ncbi:endonuclease domain-containing protein [Acinetobacter corruptisaponis]|uniref:Endonuclease domain-containing protein n=1 Tax=Acinetobacter corruptisaponis TaxID=3045147 RepID=A0ABY8S675_9GAMM|nr:endonuclease domain-containing protein [Acinetobacter sp. KCTC 92772]WHP06588.1 endonuclease domain-containing protein [Acinetobacter sp. KCTC 92772]
MTQKIFNKTEYKQRRQTLRNNMTEPEKRLWGILRNNQLGVKFRRQHGVGHYIADFYCPQLKLIIEVDGESHFSEDAQAYDKIRDKFMLELGLTTIRITNTEIMQNIDGVCEYLQQHVQQFHAKTLLV